MRADSVSTVCDWVSMGPPGLPPALAVGYADRSIYLYVLCKFLTVHVLCLRQSDMNWVSADAA